MIYSSAAAPASRFSANIMHPINTEFDWPKLRRDLEDILTIINAGHKDAQFNQSPNEQAILSILNNEAMITEAVGDNRHSEPAHRHELTRNNESDASDDLYDNAIVVLTEFGQASPAILQMWLSIDYGSAMTIMSRFQTEGLISSKGRVKHKAFSIRRSFDQQAQ